MNSHQSKVSARAVHRLLWPYSAFAFLISLGTPAVAATVAIPQAVTLPDLVTEPSVDLGETSFYDGFGKFTPGFVFIDYGRWEHLTSIKDSKGKDVIGLRDPDIEVFANDFQLVYVTPIPVPGGAIAIEANVPVVELSSSFTQPGGNLRANGFGLGDLTFGPVYQAAPIKIAGHIFSYRVEVDALAPVGSFSHYRDINQSSGFWSLLPYVAMTYLPAAGWEVTSRISYIYNLKSTSIPNAPPIPDVSIHDGQAGQAAWINFAASRAVTKAVGVGLNGYYFQQLSDDKLNGIHLAHTRKNSLYLGPGVHTQFNLTNILNVNLYLPVTVHGSPSGAQLNFQYVHVF